MNNTELPSIQKRLTKALLWFAVTTGITVSGVLWLVVRHEMNEIMDQGLRESAEIIYGVMANAPAAVGAPAYWEVAPGTDEKIIWQVVSLADQKVVQRSHSAPDAPISAFSNEEFFDAPNGQWRVVTLMFNQSRPYYLLVAQPQFERFEASTESAILALLSALVVGWVAVVVLSRITLRELRPLQALTQAVRQFDPLDVKTQPDPPRLAELAPIAEAIAELGQRLANRVQRERAFAAHAAHALRTPLAGIDAQLALALRELPTEQRPRVLRAREASQRLAQVVKALLVMFRSGTEPALQLCALSALLNTVPTPGLHLHVEGADHLNADPDLLAAVMANILDNAARHGATRVTIANNTAPGNPIQRLRFTDNGQGCPPQELHRLRDSLEQQRYTSDAGSNGLGLVLADMVMRAHQGGVLLPDTPTGFVVELYWPHHPML